MNPLSFAKALSDLRTSLETPSILCFCIDCGIENAVTQGTRHKVAWASKSASSPKDPEVEPTCGLAVLGGKVAGTQDIGAC